MDHIYKALSKPRSEQECREAHEPYALHKKIRSEDCPQSEEILSMEKKFKRLFTLSSKLLVNSPL